MNEKADKKVSRRAPQAVQLIFSKEPEISVKDIAAGVVKILLDNPQTLKPTV